MAVDKLDLLANTGAFHAHRMPTLIACQFDNLADGGRRGELLHINRP